MRNAECVIRIATRQGRTWTYVRDQDGWTQTGPTGRVHRMTAEQLLSHLLPPLTADDGRGLTVRVERRALTRPSSSRRRPRGRSGRRPDRSGA